MLRHRDQADVGETVERREFETAGPDSVEACFFGQPRRQRAMRRHDVDEAGIGHLVPEVASLAGHRFGLSFWSLERARSRPSHDQVQQMGYHKKESRPKGAAFKNL